jgi:hypothetical protein
MWLGFRMNVTSATLSFQTEAVGSTGARSFLYTTSLFLLWELRNEGLMGELM